MKKLALSLLALASITVCAQEKSMKERFDIAMKLLDLRNCTHKSYKNEVQEGIALSCQEEMNEVFKVGATEDEVYNAVVEGVTSAKVKLEKERITEEWQNNSKRPTFEALFNKAKND